MATFVTVAVGMIGVAAMLGAIVLVEGYDPERKKEAVRANRPEPRR